MKPLLNEGVTMGMRETFKYYESHVADLGIMEILPLEWEETLEGFRSAPYALKGIYYVYTEDSKIYAEYKKRGNIRKYIGDKCYDTIEEAKDACEKDFKEEARKILSSLVTFRRH